MIKTLHKLILYDDHNFLSKMLPIVTSCVINHVLVTEHGQLLALLMKIFELRWSERWIDKVGKEIAVWYIAAQEIIKLGYLFEKDWENSSAVKASFASIYEIIESTLIGSKKKPG